MKPIVIGDDLFFRSDGRTLTVREALDRLDQTIVEAKQHRDEALAERRQVEARDGDLRNDMHDIEALERWITTAKHALHTAECTRIRVRQEAIRHSAAHRLTGARRELEALMARYIPDGT